MIGCHVLAFENIEGCAPILNSLSAAASDALSTNAPRAVLMRTAVGFISVSSRSPINRREFGVGCTIRQTELMATRDQLENCIVQTLWQRFLSNMTPIPLP